MILSMLSYFLYFFFLSKFLHAIERGYNTSENHSSDNGIDILDTFFCDILIGDFRIFLCGHT